MKTCSIPVFTPIAILKTKGLTPFFLFMQWILHYRQFKSRWFALQLIDLLWSHWGFLAYHSFPQFDVDSSNKLFILRSSYYKLIFRGTSSGGWGAFTLNEMGTDPASRFLTLKFICLRVDPFFKLHNPATGNTPHVFPDAMTNQSWDSASEYNVLILWSLTSRSFLTILGTVVVTSARQRQIKWIF